MKLLMVAECQLLSVLKAQGFDLMDYITKHGNELRVTTNIYLMYISGYLVLPSMVSGKNLFLNSF